MSVSNVELTVIASAVALWFAQGWYLNLQLKAVHEKLDLTLEAFDGLRDYLYEIDPQFDDERFLLAELEESLEDDSTMSLAGASLVDLERLKKSEGRRTLADKL
ncbi:hypothetical protein [Andreprevotia chitinilytica]|uniref:hypothetical protein n=1 Tax=Andreprevotia chitinilytica TaxID=396808 RepID=UPI00054E9162|nr:hypothetical protein [Andreprevotia chitinilytica]